MPPPLTVLRKFVYFAIAQFGRKSKKQSAMFCIPIFTANTEWRNYLPICLVIMPEFYGGVKRRNIDLWPKTKLHHVNYQAIVSHRGTTFRQRRLVGNKIVQVGKPKLIETIRQMWNNKRKKYGLGFGFHCKVKSSCWGVRSGFSTIIFVTDCS